MAFAAPSWSEASAVSVVLLVYLDDYVIGEKLTNDNISLRGFLLQQVTAIIVSLYSLDLWELVCNRLALLSCTDQSSIRVLGVLVVELVQSVTANVTSGSSDEDVDHFC
jgi:hypothetical protein